MTIPEQEMPERIYAKTHGASTDVISGQRGLIGGWSEHKRDGQTEFVRADLAAPSPRAQTLEEACGPLEELASVLRKSENSYHQAQASALLERAAAIRALKSQPAQTGGGRHGE